MQREFYEWSNFWWENAPDKCSERVMLIGDSITNGYRSFLQQKLKDKKILADMAAGSRSVADPALVAELEYSLGKANNYKYKLIQFNNGLHGVHLTANEYQKGIKKLICVIKDLQPQALLIIATSTPYAEQNGQEEANSDRNRQVLERNNILKKISSELILPLNDLFEAVAGKAEYPQPDGVHFTSEGYEHLANVTEKFFIKHL